MSATGAKIYGNFCIIPILPAFSDTYCLFYFVLFCFSLLLLMAKLTEEQRARLVRLYYQHGNNAGEAIRAYRREFGVRDICGERAVRALIVKFEATRAVKDASRSGRPKTNDDVVMEVGLASMDIASKNYYGNSSVRAISTNTGIPRMTVWRCLKEFLKLYPYRIQRLHELLVGDPERRLTFGYDFLAMCALDEIWLGTILWTDEANFTLCGQVNTWNCRIWANEHPHSFIQEPLYAKKVFLSVKKIY